MKKHLTAPILFCLLALLTSPLLFSAPVTSTNSPDNISWLEKLTHKKTTLVLQLGGFSAYQGQAQNVAIVDLIGDRFTVTKHFDQNVLLGLGYFVDAYTHDKWRLLYGINAFYLADTAVEGKVIQEDLFTNLSYRYSVNNYPVYLAAKAFYNIGRTDRTNLVLDAGIGPNFIETSNFNETSLDNGVTIPDYTATGQVKTAFSATAGIGIRLNRALGNLPVEISYRYFYLGQGQFKKQNSQLITNINTGNSYANALVLSVYLE